MKPRIIFVTGTDTDVGKTVLSLLLLRALLAHGKQPVYLKPVQTGCLDPDQDSDPAFLARLLPGGLPGGLTPRQSIGVCCPEPKAPLFAACSDRESSRPAVLAEFVNAQADCDVVVVEGAGGLLVPLTRTTTMLDLAKTLDAELLLAARAGLGTINHTLLSLEVVKHAGMSCRGVILLDPQGQTAPQSIAENAWAIEHFSGQRVWGSIGPMTDLAHPHPDAVAVAARALGLSSQT